MKKLASGILVIVVLVIGGLVLAQNHTANKPANSTSHMSNMNTQSSSNTSKNSATSANSVTISNFAFSPANLSVKKGTTVTWTNQDSVAHTVQEIDGQTGPNSSALGQGKSYSFTFNSTGTFKYHCSIHPDMTGTVTVD